jgi:serine/threonine protein phosphatase PrpC
VASDGLFDNLFDDEILDITVGMTEGGTRRALQVDPQKLADMLAMRCREGGFELVAFAWI